MDKRSRTAGEDPARGRAGTAERPAPGPSAAGAPPAGRAKPGAGLVAFLRASPLRADPPVFERDRSPGRPVDFE